MPSYSSPVLASLACRSSPQGAQASQRLPPALAPSSTISLSCSQQLLFNCISTLLALSCTLFAASLSLSRSSLQFLAGIFSVFEDRPSPWRVSLLYHSYICHQGIIHTAKVGCANQKLGIIEEVAALVIDNGCVTLFDKNGLPEAVRLVSGTWQLLS